MSVKVDNATITLSSAVEKITVKHEQPAAEDERKVGSIVRMFYNTTTYRRYPRSDFAHSYAESPNGMCVKRDDFGLILKLTGHWCMFIHLDSGETGWLPVYWVTQPVVTPRVLQSKYD